VVSGTIDQFVHTDLNYHYISCTSQVHVLQNSIYIIYMCMQNLVSRTLDELLHADFDYHYILFSYFNVFVLQNLVSGTNDEFVHAHLNYHHILYTHIRYMCIGSWSSRVYIYISIYIMGAYICMYEFVAVHTDLNHNHLVSFTNLSYVNESW